MTPYLETTEEPKRVRRAEPKNVFEFCQVFSRITSRPLGLFLRETKHWRWPDWFYEVMSECKEKDRNTQAKIINWFVKERHAKAVDIP